MATYKQGYDEERFATTVNRNFFCLICFNVLREPVLCPRNQHCFCRACITKHLENSQRCPTCADKMTVECLTEPNRMVKDYLAELNIHCENFHRGCQEIVQLQHLNRHEATCGFTSVVCTNQGCGVTVNKHDLVHHESELCEFRQLKCHSCGEMTKTLTDVETRMATMESSIVTIETKIANMEKNMAAKVENVKTSLKTNMAENKTNMAEMEAKMERKIEAVNNEVKGLKTSLIEGFDEMKEVLVKMEGKKEENTRRARSRASGDKENIIVAGGSWTDSVEIFNWSQVSWSRLQSMPEKHREATSFVYNNHMTIAGGECPDSVNTMIRMNIGQTPDLSTLWSNSPVKLPTNLSCHSSVLYNDQLIVTGGYNGNLKAASDCIDAIQLVPPYTTKTLSRMPEPRQFHGSEIVDDNLFMLGGTTTGRDKDSLSSVVQYDLKGNKYEMLEPLPYAVNNMATVRWGDNIVVIGGADEHSNKLDKVAIYNVKTKQCHMLPQMKYKREGCAAVVFGDNIVVMGGHSEGGALKSVEAFNFDRYTWEELPEMSSKRWLHVAVAV